MACPSNTVLKTIGAIEVILFFFVVVVVFKSFEVASLLNEKVPVNLKLYVRKLLHMDCQIFLFKKIVKFLIQGFYWCTGLRPIGTPVWLLGHGANL